MTFTCSSCGTTLEVDGDWGGHKLDCPVCGQETVAPKIASTVAKLPEKAKRSSRADLDQYKVDTGQGGPWKFALVLLLVATGAFLLTMYHFHERSDQTLNRWVAYGKELVAYVERTVNPPKVSSVVIHPQAPAPAAPIVVQAPIPVPAPPKPVVVPQPPDPLTWLAAHSTAWPAQVVLKSDTKFPILRNGAKIGSGIIPAGDAVSLVKFSIVEHTATVAAVAYGTSTREIPVDDTNLANLAAVALQASLASPPPVQQPVASGGQGGSPALSSTTSGTVGHPANENLKGLPGYSIPYVVITTTASATSTANQPIMNFRTTGPTVAFLTVTGVNFSPNTYAWSQVQDTSNRFATTGQATFSSVKILPGDGGSQTQVTFSDKGIYQLRVVASDAGHAVTQDTWVNVWDPVPALGPNNTMGRNPSVNPPTSVQVLSHDPGPYCHPRIFFSRSDWPALNAKDLSTTNGIPEAVAATAYLKDSLGNHFDKPGDPVNTMAVAFKAYADDGYSTGAEATVTAAYQANVANIGLLWILGNTPDKQFYDALEDACYLAWVGTDPNLDHSQVGGEEKARFTYLATLVAAAAKYETVTHLVGKIETPRYGMAVAYDFIYDWMTPQQRQDTRDYLYLIGNYYNTGGGGIGRKLDGPSPDGSQQNGGDFPNMADGIILPALAIEGEEAGTDKNPGISDAVLQVAGPYWPAAIDAQLANATWPNANRCSVLNLQRQIHYNSEFMVTPWGFGCNMMDYFQLGEDTAAPCGLALARRGENEWVTTNLYQIMLHGLYNLAPRERDGKMALYDHHDGGGFCDGPGSENEMMIAKYMYPDDPLVDYVYRAFRLEAPTVDPLTTAMFAAPLRNDTLSEVATLKGLSLIKFDPFRGVAISRNGWDEKDLNLVFEDRFQFRGHNHGERNSFSLFALGRTWACAPGYHVTISDVQSQVQFQLKQFDPDPPTDGYVGTSPNSYNNEDVPGRLGGGPFAGKLLDVIEDPNKQWTWFSGDAKDAYTYRNTGTDTDIGKHTADYLYPGLLKCLIPSDQERMKTEEVKGSPYYPVLYAFRSILTVRGKNPYVIVIDDIDRDDSPNNYRWTMSPTISFGGSGGRFIGKDGGDAYSSLAMDQTKPPTPAEAILFHDPIDAGTKDGLPRLLVRDLSQTIPANAPPIFIQDEPRPDEQDPTIATNMTYGLDNNSHKYGFIATRRLIIERPGVKEPKYKVLLFPFLTGSDLPTTSWDSTGKVLKVTVGGQTDTITFDYSNEDHRTRMVSFERNGTPINR